MREISAHKSEPEWMTDFRVKAYRHFVERELPQWGGDLNTIDFDNIFYYLKPVEEQAKSWDDLPPGMKETWDKLGIPEAEKKYLAGVGAQYESEVVYHNLQKDLADQGVIFCRHRQRPARARGPVPRVLRHGHPVQRQQVRGAQLGRLVGRLVHLRAAGSQGRAAAAGLLPHQRREHGPVRAHADHRRQGRLRALRRGLHRPDLLDRLAALGRGRDHRPRQRPLPLHHHPELVDQRLQPGHQAGGGRAQRHHGVGRRQPRLAAHHEVPGGAPQGRGRPRRGALDRLCRQGPAPGRGRQDHPHGAQHVVGDHLQVDLEGRRPQPPTAASCR